MKGIRSNKSRLREKIFIEVARLAYEGYDEQKYRNIPYKIIPGEVAHYRDSVFVEREIVAERLRAAMGLSLRTYENYTSAAENVDLSLIDEKYYEPPLIDIIKFACNRCPENKVVVTSACQGCLEHPCQEVCPKKAISFKDGISYIDESKCIKCGICLNTCPYKAITRLERPCKKACGMNAIKSDNLGRASIDHNLCVSCGQCLVSCPFAAIIDKSQIFQTITAIKKGTPVYAAVAPSIAGQFGDVSFAQIRAAIKALGFADVVDVSIGADLCTVEEAKDFLREVPAEQPWMGTSCCPAWSVMAKKLFPQFASYISMALTPMVLTGRLIKKEHPGSKVVFVGPCAAKKLEASRRTIRSDVDFVLTFEELSAMMKAKEVVPSLCEPDTAGETASGAGIGFAVSGGVAAAVEQALKELAPEMEVKIAKAESLPECRKMLLLAKAGKYDGYLLEGMACPGGCVSGAGVIADFKAGAMAVQKRSKSVPMQKASDSSFLPHLEELEERGV